MCHTIIKIYHAFWKILQGLGIIVLGMAYMFVHDGFIHRGFPVGPIADVLYLLKVAATHQVCS